VVFSIQRFLEDRFKGSRLADPAQYAISLANLYYGHRDSASREAFVSRMHGLRTAFFRLNRLDRNEYEADLVKVLDRRFKKRPSQTRAPTFPLSSSPS
jgi:hypothetical protein